MLAHTKSRVASNSLLGIRHSAVGRDLSSSRWWCPAGWPGLIPEQSLKQLPDSSQVSGGEKEKRAAQGGFLESWLLTVPGTPQSGYCLVLYRARLEKYTLSLQSELPGLADSGDSSVIQ